jgi:hypothetical protein
MGDSVGGGGVGGAAILGPREGAPYLRFLSGARLGFGSYASPRSPSWTRRILEPARASRMKATAADGYPLSNASAVPGSESPPDGRPRARSATASVGRRPRTTGSGSADGRVDDRLGRA